VVAEFVAVLVLVVVAVLVAVFVTVCVAVFVAVFVALLVAVFVAVLVGVAVLPHSAAQRCALAAWVLKKPPSSSTTEGTTQLPAPPLPVPSST